MSIDTSIGDRTSEVSVTPLRYWNPILKMFLGQPKINNINFAILIEFANTEIGWLDISVNKSTRMDILDAI